METTFLKQTEELNSNQTAIYNQTFDLLEETKTNWTVNKKPLICADGFQTESFGLFRNDNNKWLGTVGKQYELMQNSTLAENIIEASLGVTQSFRGGELAGGKKIYYQAELTNEKIGHDTVKRYLTTLNSHDGSSSIGFGFTNTVVICQNTFHVALKDVNKFRHTSSAKERVKIAREQIKIMLQEENNLMDNYKRMADVKLNDSVTKKVIADLFGFKEEDFNKKTDEISTRKLNELMRFNDIIDSELISHGNTLWGLFNAVTYKTNHDDVKTIKSLENVMVGSGYRKNINAYNIIIDSLPKIHTTI
jgi:phage/plasmid-like protein (TIGR03299 family)